MVIFAASQVNENDVEVLRNKQEGASCKIEDINFTDDSTATVKVMVRNFLVLDTIGGVPQTIAEKVFCLHVIERQGVWKIHLNGLPN